MILNINNAPTGSTPEKKRTQNTHNLRTIRSKVAGQSPVDSGDQQCEVCVVFVRGSEACCGGEV